MSSPEHRSPRPVAPISFKASSATGRFNSRSNSATTSADQLAHLERVLRALKNDRTTWSLAVKIAACKERGGRTDPDERWPRYCRHPFCTFCRRAFVANRIQSALKLFDGHPRGAFRWVTVICSVREWLVRPPFAEDPVFWPDRLTHATDDHVRDAIASQVAEAKATFDRAVRELRPSLFLAQGAFEFDVVDAGCCGAQKTRLFEDLRSVDPSVPTSGHAFVLHLHALVVATRGGSYVAGGELTEALKFRFPHRHQVLVMPMRANGTVKQNVAKLTAYPLKGFSDFPDVKVVELGRALAVFGRRKLLFRREKGTRSLTPSPPAPDLTKTISRTLNRVRPKLTTICGRVGS